MCFSPPYRLQSMNSAVSYVPKSALFLLVVVLLIFSYDYGASRDWLYDPILSSLIIFQSHNGIVQFLVFLAFSAFLFGPKRTAYLLAFLAPAILVAVLIVAPYLMFILIIVAFLIIPLGILSIGFLTLHKIMSGSRFDSLLRKGKKYQDSKMAIGEYVILFSLAVATALIIFSVN